MTIDVSTRGLRIVAPDDDAVLSLEPLQGFWTAQQYLQLTDYSRRLIEFVDGFLEVPPMPTDAHQVILLFLYEALRGFVHPRGGKVLVAPIRLQIHAGSYREPDILLVRDTKDPRRQNRYWVGADLVVEIVSPDDPERDTVVKRADYAAAGIPEYWIVNPTTGTITVLTLADNGYREAAAYRRGERAMSVLLDGFGIAVDAVLDAE